jgi:ATP-binding cassette subfamily C (CFTR/MRP) protein 1
LPPPGWLQPLLVLGYKRELTQTDLPKMDPSRESGHLADEFEKNFERRRKVIEEWNAKLESGEYEPSAWDSF